MEVTQLCLTLWDPMDYTVHGILQARILKWAAFPFSRGSSQARDRTQVCHIAGRLFNQLSHKGSPRVLEWVAHPFSSGSSWHRNRTRVSCIAGGFFTNWTIREALSYHVWSGILVWFVLGISLTLSVVEHLFMCLLAILISFLEKYLFSSPAHFLNQIIWGFVIKLH